MPDTAGVWGPRRKLRMPVRHLAGESTGSFVNRLAHAHELELGELLGRVGVGRQPVNPRLPALAEVYVNRAALEHLAALSGRPPHRLQLALTNLQRRFLLPGDEPACWQWPFEVREGHLVRCCDLCALARGAREAAWLVCPDPWRVCLRHRRFTDDHRGEEPQVVRLDELPEVMRAHAERLQLQRRFGAAGTELFADGFQVVARWWARMPDLWSWTQRAWRVGLEAQELRTAPLVIYPEAVQLAREMLRYEQEGARSRAARAVWVEQVQQLMSGWGLEGDEGCELTQWLDHHSRPAASVNIGVAPEDGEEESRLLLRFAAPRDPVMVADWVSFNVIDTERQDWARGWAKLKTYVERERHARVPYGHREGATPLGQWVAEQRRAYAAGEMSGQRARRLEQLGMVWSLADERFQENLEAAKAYYGQHWTLCAPRTATALDKPLGMWLANVRRPGALEGHPEWKTALEAVDEDWNPAWPPD
ncbi:Helicase associated domain protein [Streptomyces canus]|uniref:Helicase associated domain protein n=1 Tax=Streptomyces canus TaxID=58343 RepID=UPI003F4D0BE0